MKYFRLKTFFSVFFAVSTLLTAFASQTVLPLLSEGQKAYVNMPRKERIAYFADQNSRQTMKRNGYYPLIFQVNTKDLHEIILTEVTETHVRTKEIMQDTIRIVVPSYVLVEFTKDKIKFGNLKIAAEYQWKCGNGSEGTFRTEDLAPRLMKIKDVPNVRDLGGRMTMNGKRVKQGMIYRTAGLNDNASVLRKPLSPEKLNANDGLLAKRKAELEQKIKQNEALLKQNVKEIELVPYSLQKTWTVYLPSRKMTDSDLKKLSSLKEIPPELFGGKASVMTADAKGKIAFPVPNTEDPSVFCQIFGAPADGFMQIGIGGDWFYDVYINGKLCLNLMKRGNGTVACTVDDHVINVPVRKGKNIIVIPLLSGYTSWCLAVGQPTKQVAYRAILRAEIKEAKASLKTDFSEPPEYKKGKDRLDDETRAYVVGDLGVRSDIDLRSDNECWGMKGSPAGDKVKWFHYSSASYGSMQGKAGKKAFTKVFKVFLNEKNYPVIFHCIAGQDRTGAVAFILNALLGVPEEQLFLDWEVTGFWNGNASFNHEKLFNKLYAGFDKFPGASINERVENYVLSLGFTKKDIEKFRTLMLE